MPNGYRRFRSAPLVTIAMVTYNSARFVREAIESALAQDFDDYELVVCDDFSTDATWDIVRSFDDRRIRAYRNDTNLGEYLNRNKALALARGKYIMYVDGDDIIYPHGLGQLVCVMEKFPRAAFASCLEPSEKFIYPVELDPRQFCLCAFLGPNAVANDFTQLFFRTESLRAAGGFDGRYRSGDTQIQFALGLKWHVVLTGGGLAWWRRHKGQASEAMCRNGDAVKERWRYGVETLNDPACPLTDGEKAVARHNLSRLVLRHALRLASRGQLHDAVRIALTTGIRPTEWRSLFRDYQFPYMSDVTGDQPVRTPMDAPAPTPVVARKSWRPAAMPARQRVPTRRSTLELASPAE